MPKVSQILYIGTNQSNNLIMLVVQCWFSDMNWEVYTDCKLNVIEERIFCTFSNLAENSRSSKIDNHKNILDHSDIEGGMIFPMYQDI